MAIELKCKTCGKASGVYVSDSDSIDGYECDTCRRIEVLENTVAVLQMRVNAIEEREQTR